MKTKLQITIGVVVALAIGMGIIITANDCSLYGGTGYGIVLLLLILSTYIIALIMKKIRVARATFLLWCSYWIAAYPLGIICDTPLGPSFYYLIIVLFNWPFCLFEKLFGSPVMESEPWKYLCAAVLFALVAFSLWIGIHGVSQHVKLKNKSNEKISM